MTSTRHEAATRPVVRSTMTPRRRVAGYIVIIIAAGILVGSLLAMAALPAYQLVINVIGAAALCYAAVQLLRGGSRVPAVLLTWIAAFGITAESGDHQARVNDTGALGATTTEYFLPGIMWLCLLALLIAAVAVTNLSKRAKGDL